MKKSSLTHSELSSLAEKWLKRSFSQNGHGCHVAFTEGCSRGENADVIGFRHSTPHQGSVVIEVKVSRADFLRDRKKGHRLDHNTGMGRWRYYMCPQELLQPVDLPEGYGLLWVTDQKRIQVICGALEGTKLAQTARDEKFEQYCFEQHNELKEQSLLIRMITRFNEFNDMLQIQREYNRLSQKNMQLSSTNQQLQKENNLNHRLRSDYLSAYLQASYTLHQNGLKDDFCLDFHPIEGLKAMQGLESIVQAQYKNNPDKLGYLTFIQNKIKKARFELALSLVYICKMSYRVNLSNADVLLIHDHNQFESQQLSCDCRVDSNLEQLIRADLIQVSGPDLYCAGTKFKLLAERYFT
ncbi:hypothetical protein [Pedobacter sp.]|uniref:hypothetical protein n=1 Tax=Pedobacter sp. TaxID=1411316 RepID=UPI003D7FF9D6